MNRTEEREYWARAVNEVMAATPLTMDQLAERLEVTTRTLAYWRAGKRRPTGLAAIKFHDYRRELIGEEYLAPRIMVNIGTFVHCNPSAQGAT